MRLVIRKSECKNENSKQENLVVTKRGVLKETNKNCVIVRLVPGQVANCPIGASQVDSKIIYDITNGCNPLF